MVDTKVSVKVVRTGVESQKRRFPRCPNSIPPRGSRRLKGGLVVHLGTQSQVGETGL